MPCTLWLRKLTSQLVNVVLNLNNIWGYTICPSVSSFISTFVLVSLSKLVVVYDGMMTGCMVVANSTNSNNSLLAWLVVFYIIVCIIWMRSTLSLLSLSVSVFVFGRMSIYWIDYPKTPLIVIIATTTFTTTRSITI